MRKAVFLLVCCWAVYNVSAQTSGASNDKKFDADTYLMSNEFDNALKLYLEILEQEPDNADIKHRIGICYLQSENEKEKAIPYLKEACEKVSLKYKENSFKETNAPVEAYFLLGSAYRVNNRLDEAIAAYEKYSALLDPKDSYNLDVTDQYIKSCRIASDLLQQPLQISMTNLGDAINNQLPNFNAVVSADGKTLAYTNPGRNGFEVFISTLADSLWTTPKNITSALGTGRFMKTTGISPDGTTLMLVLDDPINSDIFTSTIKKGRWSKVEALPKIINSKMNETHASFSPDGKVLYFTSNRKGGEGDLDIYKSVQEGDAWGKPQNLGPAINTPYNEETPFVSGNGNLLYFSSEGHQGMGGYDVYRYDFDHPEAGAVNIGYPLNTTDNNLFFMPVSKSNTAYIAYAGDDSYGGRDIYRVEWVERDIEVAVAVAVAEEEVAVAVAEEEVAAEEVAAEEVAAEEVAVAVAAEEVAAEEVAVAVAAEEPEVTGQARSYSVQFMALHNMADLTHFAGIPDIAVTYNHDAWYRYTWLTTTDSLEAVKIQRQLVDRGYSDSFIRRKDLVPNYTIQVMAVPGPVINLTQFANLPDITAVKGQDKFCRYTTGEYQTKEEARALLGHVKGLGYPRAFVRKFKTLQ